MKDEIDLFLRGQKKLSERTRELYRMHLKIIAGWCEEKGVKGWEELTPELMEAFLASKKWGDSHKWSSMAAVRRFYRWKSGESNPILQVKVYRRGCPPQKTLNRKQTDQLLGLFDTSTPKGIRDLAIVTLLLDTGLRATELVSIRMEHVDMDEGVLFVPCKGGEWEPAAFYEYTQACLCRWLGLREGIAKAGVDTLFVSIGGTRPGTAISRDGLRAIFHRFSKKSAIGQISPHVMRRTFATLALVAGAPTRMVQVSGRWKSIKMVELYSRALVAKQLQKYSPVNWLMGVKPKEED